MTNKTPEQKAPREAKDIELEVRPLYERAGYLQFLEKVNEAELYGINKRLNELNQEMKDRLEANQKLEKLMQVAKDQAETTPEPPNAA